MSTTRPNRFALVSPLLRHLFFNIRIFLLLMTLTAARGVTLDAFLKAANSGTDDNFGYAVAMSGDTLVIGALNEDGSGAGVNPASNDDLPDAGAVYVFVRSNGVWTQQAYLKAPVTTSLDLFGSAVAIAGDTLIVGAPREDGSGTGVNPPDDDDLGNSGAAYVFVRSNGVWTQQAYLKASNPGANDFFGDSVAISGNTVVVGATSEDGNGTGVDPADNNSASNSGAAYVFARSGSTWSQQAYLKASNTGNSDRFGRSVAVSGDTVAVGAEQEDGSGTGVNPANNNSATNAGAVYVFTRSGSTWSHQALLKPHNTGANDNFGFSVSLSAGLLVAGAPGESGSGSGSNPPSDDNAPEAGAVYVFAGGGSTWSQQAYLKPGNPDARDHFGYAVSIDQNLLAVGARDEAGSGIGVDPAASNSAPSAGAVYLFSLNGGDWSAAGYLKASNTETTDEFGRAVAVSGSSVIAGARLEDSSTGGVNPASNEIGFNSGAAYVFSGAGIVPYDPTGDTITMQPNPGGGVQLDFHGQPLGHYDVQRSTDLVVWQTLQSNAVADAGGHIIFVDLTPPDRRVFYRFLHLP